METPEEKFDAFLLENELDKQEYSIFFRVFKAEQAFEVWAQRDKESYQRVALYSFCANSGQLGPKRKEGDRQIPEGIYRVTRYNPNSQFHLSLGINYQNAVDLVHANLAALGSDIFIHGGCASIGCISITDESIDLVCRLAEQSQQPDAIEAHFFPFRFENVNLEKELKDKNDDTRVLWESLKPIYRYFETHRLLPTVKEETGKYALGS